MAAFQAPKHKSGLGQPQDEWIIREKLTLASSVQRSGDQNWVSVSRAIKPINETGCLGKVRPPDFFSQKNCAILYSQMLEKVDTPKRKRTSETGAGETPGEQIIRKLTFERIEELKKSVKNDQLTYRKLKMRMEDIRNGKMDAQLPGLWDEIQAKKRRMEEMQQLQPSGSLPTPGGDSPSIHFPGPPGINFPVAGNTAAMPGLKQSPQTTPSPHKGKQLRIPKPTPRFQKYQQQLQQRHQHGIPSGSPGDIGMTGEPTRTSIDAPRLSLEEPLKTEPMDIDPGAAVQTVSMDMPSVTPGQLATPNVEPSPSPGSTTRHLPSGNVVPQGDSLKTLLSQPAKDQGSGAQIDPAKKGSDSPQIPNAKPPQDSHTPPSSAVNQPSSKPQTTDSKSFLGNTTNPESNKLDSFRDRLSTNAGAPSVAAPTLSKLLASSSAPPNSTKTIVNSTSSNSFIDKSLSTKAIEGGINNVRSSTGMPGPGRGAIAVGGKGDGGGGGAVTAISVNPKSVLTAGTLPSPMAMTPPPTTPPAEKKEELITESVVKTIEPVPNQSERATIEEIADTKEEPEVVEGTTEHSLPVEPKIEIVDTPQPSPRVTGRTRAPKPGRPGRPRGRRSQRRSKSVTSTDNETEVEEEKEEDNKSETMEAESEKASEKDEEDDDMESTISEKKDDSDDEDEQESIDGYSESGDRSKEESFLDRSSTIGSESVPASPASQTSQGDMDSESLQAQKTWKKSIMLVWRAAANHKYANVFLHPVTDDEAPGYHGIVFRPMDLTSIKKSIENGTIRTTSEFQRDMMLMFQNALMYNNSDHDVYRMAEEMRDDVMDQIQSYIATQLMVQSSDRDSTKMLRGHRSDVFHFFL